MKNISFSECAGFIIKEKMSRRKNVKKKKCHPELVEG